MKRSRIRLQGKSTVSELKRDIQALVREIVIIRDGGPHPTILTSDAPSTRVAKG
jgi:hypothetical protein